MPTSLKSCSAALNWQRCLCRDNRHDPKPMPMSVPHDTDRMSEIRMTDAQREKHEALFGPPSDPLDYEIRHSQPLDDTGRGLDGQLRNWLQEAGFPRNDGSIVAQSLVDDAARLADASPSEIDAYSDRSRRQLERLWGAQYEANWALVRRLVEDIERVRPGLRTWFETVPAIGSNYQLLAKAAEIAKRRYGSER